jgi:hypothetical protein
MSTNANTSVPKTEASLSGDHAQILLERLSTWGPLTTIIFAGGSVFEFKGAFPNGSIAEGFYNFGHAGSEGFQGHLNLRNVKSIAFQDKLHRGRQSYAFVFRDKKSACIFKIFLGRGANGELITEQIEAFNKIRAELTV